ncbi:hypothetical protein Ciccas_002045, partial [Cichlidogyrus casuarinus]
MTLSPAALYCSAGQLFRLTNGRSRRLEELRMEDFSASWNSFCQAEPEKACELRLCWARVNRITASAAGASLLRITFTVHPGRKRPLLSPQQAIASSPSSSSCSSQQRLFNKKATVCYECPPAQPLFVFAEGWAAADPKACTQMHGLRCKRLSVGDDCLVLLKGAKQQLRHSNNSVATPLPNYSQASAPTLMLQLMLMHRALRYKASASATDKAAALASTSLQTKEERSHK